MQTSHQQEAQHASQSRLQHPDPHCHSVETQRRPLSRPRVRCRGSARISDHLWPARLFSRAQTQFLFDSGRDQRHPHRRHEPAEIAAAVHCDQGCHHARATAFATLVSIYTRYPLVRTFLYNDQILHIEKVSAALHEHNAHEEFERHLKVASFLVAGSFFLSSFLNYMLAKMILVSPPGSTELAEELGKMTALSFPVIAVPCTLVLAGTLFYLLHNIQKLTRLTLDEIIQES